MNVSALDLTNKIRNNLLNSKQCLIVASLFERLRTKPGYFISFQYCKVSELQSGFVRTQYACDTLWRVTSPLT